MSALLIAEIEYGTPRATRIMNEFWANPVKGIMLQRRASLAEFMRRWGDSELQEKNQTLFRIEPNTKSHNHNVVQSKEGLATKAICNML